MPHFDPLKICNCGKHCNKQFHLFSQCFLPYMALIFHFKCTLKCHLQFVLIWISLKFCRLVMGYTICRLILSYSKSVLKSLWLMEKFYIKVPIGANQKMFFDKIQVNPIHTILKYGIYYDFMDR